MLAALLSLAALIRLVQLGLYKSWSATSTAITAVFLATAGPSIASKAAGQQLMYYTALGEPVTVNGALYERISTITDGLLLLVVAFEVLHMIRRAGRNPVGNMPVAVAFCAITGTMLVGTLFHSEGNISRGFLLVSTLTLMLLLRTHSIRGVAVAGLLISMTILFSSSVFGLFGGHSAITTCRADKCGFTGVLFSGVMSHENSLGLLLVLLLPLLSLVHDRLLRFFGITAVSTLILASGSRTSLLALLAVLTVWKVSTVGFGQWSKEHPLALQRASLLIPVGCFGAATYLVLASSDDPSAFTGRAQLWNLALGAIWDDPAFGKGLYGWAEIRQTTGAFGAAAGYSPHNQLLDVALQGGVLAGIAFIILTFVWVKYAWYGSMPAALFITAVAVAGISERPLALGVPDWSSVALVAGVVLLTAKPSPARISSLSQELANPNRLKAISNAD